MYIDNVYRQPKKWQPSFTGDIDCLKVLSKFGIELEPSYQFTIQVVCFIYLFVYSFKSLFSKMYIIYFQKGNYCLIAYLHLDGD